MSGRGTITRRGKTSWRVKIDRGVDPETGQRRRTQFTVRGKRQDAEKARTNALRALDTGTHVDPSTITVAEHMRSWLDASEVSPKTLERYRDLAEQQVIPHLGETLLQELRPADIKRWHGTLLKGGGKDGRPLAARTVGHAHRVLHTALASAAKVELVSRNVASIISPPKVKVDEVETLDAATLADVLTKLKGHQLHPIVTLAIGTGMRRGEIVALRWSDIDLETGALRVTRSLEQTRAGLRFKEPKTRTGRRTIALPASVIAVLKDHRRGQLEHFIRCGLGRPELVFPLYNGEPMKPDYLTRLWQRARDRLGLPSVKFHSLRHSHASELIAAGLDILAVSRRLGHSSANVTLGIYGHRIANRDEAAAAAMDAALGAEI